jgi:c-di-GMP-binding flagellar brake protein YcgR
MTYRHEDSPFALHNHKEIIYILDDLAKQHTALNLDTYEGVGMVTSVLQVSSERDYVYLDISHDEKINTQIKNSRQVTFSTQAGIKVRWYAAHLNIVTLQDGQAFSMTVPAFIERIQRREYFRIDTQMGSKTLFCKIPFGAGFIEVALVDMSIGGLGIKIKGALPEIFIQDEILDGCSVEFPEVGAVPLRLKICGIWDSSHAKDGETLHHIGFEFLNLSRSAENVVQRHMIQLERERINLREP